MSFGVAVLGTGRIGGNYIDVVKNTPGAEVKVVAEPREDVAASWQDQTPRRRFRSRLPRHAGT